MIKDYDPNNTETVRITGGNETTHIAFTKEELWELHSLLLVLENKGYFEMEKNAHNAFMKIKEGLKFYD